MGILLSCRLVETNAVDYYQGLYDFKKIVNGTATAAKIHKGFYIDMDQLKSKMNMTASMTWSLIDPLTASKNVADAFGAIKAPKNNALKQLQKLLVRTNTVASVTGGLSDALTSIIANESIYNQELYYAWQGTELGFDAGKEMGLTLHSYYIIDKDGNHSSLKEVVGRVKTAYDNLNGVDNFDVGNDAGTDAANKAFTNANLPIHQHEPGPTMLHWTMASVKHLHGVFTALSGASKDVKKAAELVNDNAVALADGDEKGQQYSSTTSSTMTAFNEFYKTQLDSLYSDIAVDAFKSFKVWSVVIELADKQCMVIGPWLPIKITEHIDYSNVGIEDDKSSIDKTNNFSIQQGTTEYPLHAQLSIDRVAFCGSSAAQAGQGLIALVSKD